MSAKKASGFRKALKIILVVLLAILLIVIAYLAYVLLSYNRIDDNQPLTVDGGEKTGTMNPGETYTILTNNFGFGAYTPDFTFFLDGGKESWARSEESVYACMDDAVKLYQSYDPDILLLQEVDYDSTRTYHIDQYKYFCEKMNDQQSVFAVNFHSSFLFWPLTQPHGFSRSGIATFSKYPLRDPVRYSLPISEDFSKFLDLDRCFTVTRTPVSNGKDLVIVNVHASAYGTNPEIRSAQMGKLFNALKEEYDKGNYVICGGDFNADYTGTSVKLFNNLDETDRTWAQPFPVELLPEGISRCLDYANEKPVPTCRDCDIPYCEESFTVTIDGFLVSDNVSVIRQEIVDNQFKFSDHNPVFMQFQLK